MLLHMTPDPETAAKIQRLEQLVALLQGALGAQLAGGTLQAGTAVLAAGSSPAIAAVITANSRIVVTTKSPGAGAITGFATYDTNSARVIGSPGSFVIRALDDAKAVIGTASPTVDWHIVNTP